MRWLLILLILSPCHAQDWSPWGLSSDASPPAVSDDVVPVLPWPAGYTLEVYGGPWCTHCVRWQDSEEPQLPADMIVHYDVTTDEGKEAVKKNQVPDAFPYFLIKDADGNIKRRCRGFMRAATLSRMAGESAESRAADADTVTATGGQNYPTHQQRWNVNGNWRPSRGEVINHLTSTHGQRRQSLETWTLAELLSLHDDLHDGRR